MDQPKELSVAEIRNYMLRNDGRVTNHALVKHFKKFLTNSHTQNEARKRFKTYVTLLSTIKNENNQKFLILRKKYINECPSAEAIEAANSSLEPFSPGGNSNNNACPPYRPPPELKPTPATTGITVHQEHKENYQECVNEFAAAIQRLEPKTPERKSSFSCKEDEIDSSLNISKSISRGNSVDDTINSENISRFSFSSGASTDSSITEKLSGTEVGTDVSDNPISVKEATRKFNRMASEEEAKIISPPAKKKPEKELIEEKDSPEVTLAHPKAKEWIVSMAKANYQELAKLAGEFPELVKLQDPTTTALHWAAKHGNEDVVKLIAGTFKADVNAKSNGGYTPLHLATQFGRDNIFELLWNVYKADRDITDWNGNKPLDYSRQRPSISASTCSKIKARKKHTIEKDLGFLRIGSLNVRVKKTTEAFSNFLGVGNGSGPVPMGYGTGGAASAAARPHQQSHRHFHQRHHPHRAGTTLNRHQTQSATPSTLKEANSNLVGSRTSVPNNRTKYDMVYKSWGSADNITQRSEDLMPPPKSIEQINKRNRSSKRSSYASNATDSPRDSICSSASSSNLCNGYSSMPTTPNQIRAPKDIVASFAADSDSDSACGFDSNWSVNMKKVAN